MKTTVRSGHTRLQSASLEPSPAGATLRLARDWPLPHVHAAASALAKKTRDITEFLATLGLSAPLIPIPTRVTYQDSCHLLHGQKIREAPRQLLRAIPGVELVELPFADICCGSAGVYNVTETKASLDLLAEKMAWAKTTNASIIATANPGCLLQLRAGATIHNTGQEVLHVIELLDRAVFKTPA